MYELDPQRQPICTAHLLRDAPQFLALFHISVYICVLLLREEAYVQHNSFSIVAGVFIIHQLLCFYAVSAIRQHKADRYYKPVR